MEHLEEALSLLDSDYEKSREKLRQSAIDLGLVFETTGMLGKRTIHQTKLTCQLVLLIKRNSNNNNPTLEFNSPCPKIIPLNSPEGLLDFPEIPDFLHSSSAPQCTPEEQAVLFGEISFLTRAESIQDPAFREQLRPFWQFLILQPKCHPVVLWVSLWQRSILESFDEHRLRRSCLQLLELLPLYHQIIQDPFARYVEFPKLNELKKTTADLCFQSGLYEKALELWKEIGDWSRFFHISHSLGLDIGPEIDKLEEQEQQESTVAISAEILYWKGFIGKDLELLERSWSLSNEPKALSLMAKLLYEQQRFQEAKEKVSQALALKSQIPSDWYVLGMCESDLGNWKSALSAFQRLVALKPEDPRAWQLLSDVQTRLSQHKEAIQSMKAAYLLIQPTFEQWKSFEETCRRYGHHSEAEFALKKARDVLRY